MVRDILARSVPAKRLLVLCSAQLKLETVSAPYGLRNDETE